jgi:glycerophosphoryl diester phosphodiesterase
MYQTLFGTAPEDVANGGNNDGEDTGLEALFGTADIDVIEADIDVIEIEGSNQLVFAGEGDDLIDLSQSEGGNRAYGGSGNDVFILGKSDRLVGGDDSDRFFTLEGGENLVTGNEGADQFWIAVAEIPESANTITDFESGADVFGVFIYLYVARLFLQF